MKNLIVLLTILSVSFVNAQAFKGKEDDKFQIGANFQDYVSGINVSYDFGIGENISLGFSSTYALNIDAVPNIDFPDRFDVKARLNANLGSVLNMGDKFDFYPGLNLGLKNFGAHAGIRYFLSEGFGFYTELNLPISKYDTSDLTQEQKIHNQFTLNLGVVFGI